jgi:hypothetical protein
MLESNRRHGDPPESPKARSKPSDSFCRFVAARACARTRIAEKAVNLVSEPELNLTRSGTLFRCESLGRAISDLLGKVTALTDLPSVASASRLDQVGRVAMRANDAGID